MSHRGQVSVFPSGQVKTIARAPVALTKPGLNLDDGESRQGSGAGGENPAAKNMLTSEALAVLLGGGKDKTDEGQKILTAVRQGQTKEYFQRPKSAGFDDRVANGRVNPALLEAYKGLMEA